MPSVKWVLLVALVLGCLIGWLIKSGLTVRTGEESAVRPGHPVETHHEQAASSYLRMKDTLRGIQKKKDEQGF